MTLLALSLAVAALMAAFLGLRDARDDLAGLGRADWLTLLGATALGVAVSLLTFDAVGHHAFRAHEEQLFAVFTGQAERSSFHPAELQLLIGWIYEQVGRHVGRSMPVFVSTALLLGGAGPLLAGLAGRLGTGRWLGGAVPALLLATQPTLVYWRVHGFHVAPAHAAFCLCLLFAVLVARRGSRARYSAWLLWGALTVFLRLDLGGAVLGTAALPLLAGRGEDLRRRSLWGPGLAVAALLFALPEGRLLFAVERREDYRLGLRFLLLNGPVLLRQLVAPGGVLLVGAAALGASGWGRRPFGRACALIGLCGILPPLLFIDFGARHTLASATALYLGAGAGLVALQERWPRLGAWPPLRSGRSADASTPPSAPADPCACPMRGGSAVRPRRGSASRSTPSATMARLLAPAAAAALLVSLAVPWAGELQDLARRYGVVGSEPPSLPGVQPPSSPPREGWQRCAIYSNVQSICDRSPNCHPVKDLRDPELVRRRWDEFDGCVLWTVDPTYLEVAGVQQEWWPIVRSLYPSEAVGRVLAPRQEAEPERVDIYRITRRP